MTNREFHPQCRKSETLGFQRVLNAMPQDKFQYTPHDRSQTAMKIVGTLTFESLACSELVKKGEFTLGPMPELSPAGQIDAFSKAWDGLLHDVEHMDEATWAQPGRFLLNGQVRMEQPIGQFFWLFFFDAIHHRGQLSAYIRPMGGRVPSIYGPSGDDPMMSSVGKARLD